MEVQIIRPTSIKLPLHSSLGHMSVRVHADVCMCVCLCVCACMTYVCVCVSVCVCVRPTVTGGYLKSMTKGPLRLGELGRWTRSTEQALLTGGRVRVLGSSPLSPTSPTQTAALLGLHMSRLPKSIRLSRYLKFSMLIIRKSPLPPSHPTALLTHTHSHSHTHRDTQGYFRRQL